MRLPVVIDTNVYLVANGATPHVSLACQERSAQTLEEIIENGTVLVDADREIFTEYIGYLQFSGQPGVGDRFFRWLWDHQGHTDLCGMVQLHRSNEPRMYMEFPNDPQLADFDRSDRKFVAVALASGLNPAILNSSDSDWWEFGDALEANGVLIRNLCPELQNSGD